MEGRDLSKLNAQFDPIHFDVILSFNFHNDDFNWVDLKIALPDKKQEQNSAKF